MNTHKLFYITTILFVGIIYSSKINSSILNRNNKAAVAQKIKKHKVNPFLKGENIYKETCIACHQSNGTGMPRIFPPLAQSDYLITNKNRAISNIINGISSTIVVNGVTYNKTMPAQDLTDQQVVDVMNYVLNSWGNKGGRVTTKEVIKQR